VFCVPLRLVVFIERADSPPEEKRIACSISTAGTRPWRRRRRRRVSDANEAGRHPERLLYREALEKAKSSRSRIAAEISRASCRPPGRPTLRRVGTTVPCRAIGGDFFILTMVDGSAGFVVADVAGKGAPAALLTAVTQGVLATQTSFGGGGPRWRASIEVLIRRAVASRFMTIFRGDRREGRSPATQSLPGEQEHGAPLETGGSSAGSSRRPPTTRRRFSSSRATCS
jgi:hypothetical protein